MATLGKTTVGAYQDSIPSGYTVGSMFTASERGQVTAIKAYLNARAAGLCIAKVYDDLDGKANRLMAESAQVSMPTGFQWFIFPINVTIEAGQKYWLIFHGNVQIDYKYDDVFGILEANLNLTTYSWGLTFPVNRPVFYVPDDTNSAGAQYQPWLVSIYAEYTPLVGTTALITISATQGGTTQPPIGQTIVTIPTTLTLNAIPDIDYTFLKWTINGVDALGSTVTLTVNGDITAQATFQAIGTTPIDAPPLTDMPTGDGIWKTTLRMAGASNDETAMIRVEGGNTNRTNRVAGLNLVGFREPNPPFIGYDGIIVNDCLDYRIDHCKFSDFGYGGIAVQGILTRGLIDRNEFWNIMKGTTYDNMIHIGYGIGVIKTYNVASMPWKALAEILGKYDGNQFIEDNYFSGCRHSVACFAGGIYVLRHNVLTEQHCMYQAGVADMHGAYPNCKGGRAMEVYSNKFLNPSSNPFYPYPYNMSINSRPVNFRGGGGVVFNNEMHDVTYAMLLSGDDGNTQYPECIAQDINFWDNLLINVGAIIDPSTGGYAIGSYALTQRPNYAIFPYPHYLTKWQVKTGATVKAASGLIRDIQIAIGLVAFRGGGNVIVPDGDWMDTYSVSNFVAVPAGIDLYGETFYNENIGTLPPPTVPQHTLTISSDGEGTSNPANGSYLYNEGTAVQIAVLTGTLVSWELDGAAMTGQSQVTMDADHMVMLHFSTVHICPAGYHWDEATQSCVLDTPPITPPSGCFIATACYGSPTHQKVCELRAAKNRLVARSRAAQVFYRLYYVFSPSIADFIRERENLKKPIRKVIEWLTCRLKKNLPL